MYKSPMFWVIAALTILALVLRIGLAYQFSSLENLIQRQQQYQDYGNTLNNLLYSLTSAETGQRGYLITQNTAYLAPYTSALPAVQKDIKTLQTSPLSSQFKPQISEITAIANKKMSELKLTVATVHSQGQAAAFAIVNTNVGINDMATLKHLIGGISATQGNNIRANITAAKARVQLLGYAAPFATVTDVFLVAAILYLSRKAMKKEQQLDVLQEQFVAIASHQLRTPATIVKQYLNLLLDGVFGKLSKKQKDVLAIVSASNERGIKVANDLLSIARIDNKEINVSGEPVDLCQLLTQVINHYREALSKSKQQKLVVRMPKRAVMARVDPFYVSLIFENLIENASKYSEDHKKIYVTLKSTHGFITFSVKDQGDGIDQNDASLLFKKFSRLNEAVKKVEGSGLGLYLVKQAALLHGGDAIVQSTLGKGSTFTVTLKQET